mgnify:CR=1 FL=1
MTKKKNLVYILQRAINIYIKDTFVTCPNLELAVFCYPTVPIIAILLKGNYLMDMK